ncbi:MAG: chemotaxis protein CheX [Deltaproteobacteria bacterium]|nr:chemotaxis protein CheX [Deltaproteobacteria bacterium]
MKAELINPFLVATKNVLETMCQIKVQAQKPRLKEDTYSYGDITGIIGMASKSIRGCMVLSFSEGCILQIVANMLYEDPKPAITDETIDAVGELTNMISGGAKAMLSKLNQTFDLSTPTLVVGKGVEISYYTDLPTIVIPFTTEYGDFVVEANLGRK